MRRNGICGKAHRRRRLKRRIMDMGITKGTEIYVRKVAPLGDPVEVTSGATSFPIRKSEAENIQVAG